MSKSFGGGVRTSATMSDHEHEESKEQSSVPDPAKVKPKLDKDLYDFKKKKEQDKSYGITEVQFQNIHFK